MKRINHLWGYLLFLLIPDALTGGILIADACGKPCVQGPEISISTTGMEQDTLVLFYKGRFYLNMLDFQDNICLPLPKKNHRFSFRIPECSDGYFYIARKQGSGGASNYEPISPPYYYFEPGDQIEIAVQRKNESDYYFKFKGKGSGKYNLKTKLVEAMLAEPAKLNHDKNSADFLLNDPVQIKNNRALAVLEAKKKMISDLLYQKFKAEVQFDNSAERYYAISQEYVKYFLSSSQHSKDSFIRKLDTYYKNVEQTDASTQILAQSPEYIEYLFYKAKMYSVLPQGREDLQGTYDYIIQHYDGEVREKLLTKLYLEPKLPRSVSAGYLSFLNGLGFSDLSFALKRKSGRYAGQVIPDFQMTDSSGKEILWSAYRGKTVVVDFWFSGCGSCVYLYKGVLKKMEDKYRDHPEVVFVSICIDVSREKWMRSLYSEQYSNVKGAENWYTGGTGGQHPLLKQYGINSFPTVMILDRDGRIARIDDSELYDAPGLQSAIEQISLFL